MSKRVNNRKGSRVKGKVRNDAARTIHGMRLLQALQKDDSICMPHSFGRNGLPYNFHGKRGQRTAARRKK